jgi:hypothetical protein
MNLLRKEMMTFHFSRLITYNGNRYENGFLRIDNMEELEKIITAMLDHIDEHKDAYNKFNIWCCN